MGSGNKGRTTSCSQKMLAKTNMSLYSVRNYLRFRPISKVDILVQNPRFPWVHGRLASPKTGQKSQCPLFSDTMSVINDFQHVN